MSNFTSDPHLSLANDAKSATVEKGFKYHVFKENSGVFVEVKAGVQTDGMTLPKFLSFLRPLVPRWAYVKASLVHDVLCKERIVFCCIRGKLTLSQKAIDKQFYLALKALGATEFRARTYYYAVKIFQMFKRGFKNY